MNEQAIAVRNTAGYTPALQTPISFAYDLRSALGFARRGHIDGAVISINVDLADVVFSDREGFYREGNAHQEAEIVAVLSKKPEIRIEHRLVRPATPLLTSKGARELWWKEADRLLAVEAASILAEESV